MLIARNPEGLEETRKDIQNINPNTKVLTQALDIRDETAVQALFANIKTEFGSADVLYGFSLPILSILDLSSRHF